MGQTGFGPIRYHFRLSATDRGYKRAAALRSISHLFKREEREGKTAGGRTETAEPEVEVDLAFHSLSDLIFQLLFLLT